MIVWLSFQAIVPFVLKFDVPRFEYRKRRFSWGMYGSLPLDYSISLTMGDGQEIPGIESFVASYQSPGWMATPDGYMSQEEIEERLAKLVRHIAEARADNASYTARIDWRQPARPDWRYTWPAD